MKTFKTTGRISIVVWIIGLMILISVPVDLDARKRRTSRVSPPSGVNTQQSMEANEAEVASKLVKIRQDLALQIKQKRVAEIEKTLTGIPDSLLNTDEKRMKDIFKQIATVETDVQESSSQFFKEDDLEEATQKTLKRLYKEAKYVLLVGDTNIAKDLLIHMLHLHRRNAKAKKMLSQFLNLKTGAYKVENMESKYWKLSSIHFYGGNYQDAINDLTVYGLIDTDNPETYERMGSSYYMLGENKKAVESWTSALFLDPDDRSLEAAISKATKYEQEQKILDKERRTLRRNVHSGKVIPDSESQLLGVFPTRTKAYTYAQKLKVKGITAYVAELDNGKWSVRAAKSDMKQSN